jgi:glycosyltransferase involved in cell wall biosynthesis
MKIRVAMIADYPDAGRPIDGGVQAVTSYLVDSFALFNEIELFILSFRDEIDSISIQGRSNCTQYLIPFSKRGLLNNFKRDQIAFDQCLDQIRPHIVHSQGAGHHGILASRSAYPNVITIHGIHREEAAYRPNLRARIRKRTQAWLSDHYCIRNATNTIVISPYVVDYFGDELSGNRFTIPNPVDTRFFEVERYPERSKILFMGRLYALKGVHDLIHAASEMKEHRNLEIVLAGSTSDSSYVKELRREIHKSNMCDRVTFRGIIEAEEILKELATCTCLVLPSYQETAPMVVQEAMAAGSPVIASRICGIPYQIEDGITGLMFPPGDRNALGECMSLVLSDVALRKRLGEAAKRKANKEYRANVVARQILDVYRSVID